MALNHFNIKFPNQNWSQYMYIILIFKYISKLVNIPLRVYFPYMNDLFIWIGKSIQVSLSRKCRCCMRRVVSVLCLRTTHSVSEFNKKVNEMLHDAIARNSRRFCVQYSCAVKVKTCRKCLAQYLRII